MASLARCFEYSDTLSRLEDIVMALMAHHNLPQVKRREVARLLQDLEDILDGGRSNPDDD